MLMLTLHNQRMHKLSTAADPIVVAPHGVDRTLGRQYVDLGVFAFRSLRGATGE